MGRPAKVVQPLGIFYYIFLIFSISSNGVSSTNTSEERKIYIVYMGSLPENQEYSPSTHHLHILQQVVDNRFVEKSFIRSYKRSFNGFAAYLTDQEQQTIAGREDVKLIFPSQTLQLHTTSSWDFMKFHQDVPRNLPLESDIIIGVIDPGIWPESESFNDHGVGPIPKKWKGACEGGKNFTCNKKIIGARNYFFRDEDSARDLDGHGSHTASIAAGNNVKNASYNRIGEGTARGAVPSARIAAYKVCSFTCDAHVILAAFDDAIADGVDILSVSLGMPRLPPIQNDPIAIGSFHALEKGILTVQSAGNDHNYGTVVSTAPWIFTVAASTISRKFVAKVALGNGNILLGNKINGLDLKGKQFPLVNAKYVGKKTCTQEHAENCSRDCLEESLVEGKIVLCNITDTFGITHEVRRSGGVGAILVDNGQAPSVEHFPYSPISSTDFKLVAEYIESTKNPTATFLRSDSIEDVTAPIIADFSSKGPNPNFPDILKPDITAPGYTILAAYSPVSSLGDLVDYYILSGTSMSCPHVTGAAAYVKSFHPHWSPSAIKSALMTTAWKMNATNIEHKYAEFAYGAGHLNPTNAVQPGLVYETLKSDNVRWLCGLNISDLTKIFGDNVTCEGAIPIESKDLNYPTMVAEVQEGKSFSVTFSRTVKNVGPPNSTYMAKIVKSSKLNITVQPDMLPFKASNETKSFKVTVAGEIFEIALASASLEWFDGFHTVRSPIVIHIPSRKPFVQA